MKTPPLLIGGSLVFWGIETDNLIIGLMLCLLFEGSNLLKTRYHLTEDDFVKISDLTSLVFLGSVALVLLNYEPLGFLRITTGWLPLILSPLMLAQLYSTKDEIVIGTRLGKKEKAYTHKPIDFRFYYVIICLFASATSNSRSIWFFPVMAILISLLLYSNRGRAYSSPFFVIFIVASFVLGYGCVVALEQSHRYVMQKSFRLWHQYYREQHGDPYKSHVNFGDTGRMKLSAEIIMRVESSSGPPELLKEASFTSYRQGDWFGNQRGFEFVVPVSDGNWSLLEPAPKDGNKVKVDFNLPREKGLLPVAHGTYHINSSTIFELEQNRFGTVKVVDGAEIISYELSYNQAVHKKEDRPIRRNLDVPDKELYVLEKVAGGLQLSDSTASGKIEAVTNYFNKGFSYSLSLLGKGEYETALGNFLLNRKRGFCEYYATATALLLRNLGVPSRYAIGYAVRERSGLEGKYVVRKRHAHAWAEAFVDDHWVVVDTTPPDWFMKDAEGASIFEMLRDIFSFARHKYKKFQIGSGEDYTLTFSIIVVVLTAFLVIRIYRRMKLEQAKKSEESEIIRSFDSIDSPFNQVIEIVEKSDVPRRNDESLVQWAERASIWEDFDGSQFSRLYRLHLQLRFDPQGLSGAQMIVLQEGAREYLELETITR